MSADKRREVWVQLDPRHERLLEQSLKVLAKGRGLAQGLNAPAVAVIFETGPACLDPEQTAQAAIQHGAGRVLVLHHPLIKSSRADLQARALAPLLAERNPWAMLFPLSDFGRELAARAAAILERGLIADAESFTVADGRIVASCPAWGGKMNAEIHFADLTRTGLVTVGAHGHAMETEPGRPGEIEKIEILDLSDDGRLELISSEPEPEERRRLEEAVRVVVGGAGLGSAEGFHLVRELAAALGAEVGATRPAVLAHWADEERLIGQTGKSIRPSLLISVGTSGAVQYTAGIHEARTVVAINRDPDARIFEAADLGLAGDARVLLPLITEKIKRLRLRELADLVGGSCAKTGGASGGFGGKVRAMRESMGWSAGDLASKSGSTPEFIEGVEAGETEPSVAFLLRLAKALGVDPGTFLSDEEKNGLRERRADSFQKRTQNYSYQTLTSQADHAHLKGFMIVIEPRQAHKPVAYKHEGEEFIFVMEGELELILGGKSHHLKPGEHLHFDSETPHQLKSLSDRPTRCLVMLYAP